MICLACATRMKPPLTATQAFGLRTQAALPYRASNGRLSTMIHAGQWYPQFCGIGRSCVLSSFQKKSKGERSGEQGGCATRKTATPSRPPSGASATTASVSTAASPAWSRCSCCPCCRLPFVQWQRIPVRTGPSWQRPVSRGAFNLVRHSVKFCEQI